MSIWWLIKLSTLSLSLIHISVVLVFAHIIALNHDRMGSFAVGVLPFALVLGAVAVLMLLEPCLLYTSILAMTVTFSITMLIAMRLFDSTVSSVKEKESMYNKVAEVDRYVRSNCLLYTSSSTMLSSLR